MKTFFVTLIIIIAYLSGYHAGRYTTPGWKYCKDELPMASGYYMVTIAGEDYANIMYWSVYDGWYKDKGCEVIAWKHRIKGWR